MSVLVLALAVPAEAGTEDDPEVQSPCDPSGPVGWGDLCAAWFEGIWQPDTDDTGQVTGQELIGVRVSVDLAGDVASRPSTWYMHIRWNIENAASYCHQWLSVHRAGGPIVVANHLPGGPLEGEMRLWGGDCDAPTGDLGIPADRITASGNRVVLELLFDDMIAGVVRDYYGQGDKLTNLGLSVSAGGYLLRAETGLESTQANVTKTDEAWSQSTFVLGDDRPAS